MSAVRSLASEFPKDLSGYLKSLSRDDLHTAVTLVGEVLKSKEIGSDSRANAAKAAGFLIGTDLLPEEQRNSLITGIDNPPISDLRQVHRRAERTRLIILALHHVGYSDTANAHRYEPLLNLLKKPPSIGMSLRLGSNNALVAARYNLDEICDRLDANVIPSEVLEEVNKIREKARSR